MIFGQVGREKDNYKVWIPEQIRSKIVNYIHSKYGHFGAGKVEKIIRELGYWKSMGKSIRKILAGCHLCQMSKYPNRQYAGQMLNIIPLEKNKLFSADIYGPLPRAIRGNMNLFVIMDVFSKVTHLYPITRPTTKNCARCVKHFVTLYGSSERILTDNGSQFANERWIEEMNALGMNAIFSSIRAPQGNPSERVMREISRLFRAYCHQKHTLWVELVPHINRWLLYIPHESSGITPYEAHFKRKPEREFKQWMTEEEKNDIGTQRDLTGLILGNLERAGRKRRKAMKGKPHQFKIGDRVLLRAPKPSDKKLKLFTKFFLLYEGPLRIQEITGTNAAKLIDDNGSLKGRYNFRSLKPCIEPVN